MGFDAIFSEFRKEKEKYNIAYLSFFQSLTIYLPIYVNVGITHQLAIE